METLYLVIYYSIESNPSIAEIKAGQKSGGGTPVYAGSITAPTVSIVDTTWPDTSLNLVPGESYKHALVWSDGIYDEVSYSSAWIATRMPPILSNITLINIGTTYGTPRMTVTFS